MGHSGECGEPEGRGQSLLVLLELQCRHLTQPVRHSAGRSSNKPQARDLHRHATVYVAIRKPPVEVQAVGSL